MSVLWLCTGAATALAVFTLRRAYILTSLVLSVPGLPLPPPSRAWWVQSRVLLALLAPRAVPGFLRLALIPLVSGWGYARDGSLSKTVVCFAMLAGLEPAPSEACVRFPMPSPQSAGGSCLPASASCVGPFRRPRGVYASSIRSMLRWLYA